MFGGGGGDENFGLTGGFGITCCKSTTRVGSGVDGGGAGGGGACGGDGSGAASRDLGEVRLE